ncbi:HPP family protein [Antarcticirhabdus aurantiaca]|uniref:HPP family protein n=1 Tax=Antarcticirhabdus aurantiaca TaxID=2606717 RepID=A0ACD4NSN8_9HYPH|nr:HPP family protein [Antarcticirhabdus aurantiaca]WAJ29809.1 HPP family protein [Jeongeuplla avenae]
MHPFLRRFLPDLVSVSRREQLRASIGAGVGILGTAVVSRTALGEAPGLPFLVAPMGASAVLLFAVPASPLAQPWSILGGNLVASLVGVTVARLVPDPGLAAALAITLAIAIMMALRCLHPPSGAVALTAVLGGEGIRALGYGFVVWPILANSALMLGAALLFNNATGRRYPHAAPSAPVERGTADPPPTARLGFTSADLDAVLAEFDQVIDVDRSDLEAILRRAEQRFLAHRAGTRTCAEIMSRDVVAVGPDASFREAMDLLRRHHIKALPVTDEGARILGLVTQTDLLEKTAWGPKGPRLAFRHRLRLTASRTRAPASTVADIMTAAPATVRRDTLVAAIAPVMADAGLHHLPVVEADGRLVGIVSQTDVVAALLAELGARAAGAQPAEALPA